MLANPRGVPLASREGMRSASATLWMLFVALLSVAGCAPGSTELATVEFAQLCSLRTTLMGFEVWVRGPIDTGAPIAYGDNDFGDAPTLHACDGTACCGATQFLYTVDCGLATIAIAPAHLGDHTTEVDPDVVERATVCHAFWDGTQASAGCRAECPEPGVEGDAQDVVRMRGVLSIVPTARLPSGAPGRPLYVFSVREVVLPSRFTDTGPPRPVDAGPPMDVGPRPDARPDVGQNEFPDGSCWSTGFCPGDAGQDAAVIDAGQDAAVIDDAASDDAG